MCFKRGCDHTRRHSDFQSLVLHRTARYPGALSRAAQAPFVRAGHLGYVQQLTAAYNANNDKYDESPGHHCPGDHC